MGKWWLGNYKGSKQGKIVAFSRQQKRHLSHKTMKQARTPPDNSFQIRCPRLGQQIHFSYCRQENMGLPCFKTLDCWYIHFPVVEYLQQDISPTEWQKTFEEPPTPKMVSLAELIEKAQKLAPKKK